MKDFFDITFKIGIVILLLILSPFLFIFGVNTLFNVGITHGVMEYLAVWALVVTLRGVTQ
jgi:hypothetical protein